MPFGVNGSGTKLTYNNVVLHGCSLLKFEQTAEKDPSGTDRMFDKYSIRVRGYVFGAGTVSDDDLEIGVSSPKIKSKLFVGNAANIYTNIKTALMTIRKPFELEMDNAQLLSVEPHDGGEEITSKDVNNGPKPLSLSIHHVTAANMFRVEYEIEVCLVTCDETGEGGNRIVLSNRWSVQDDIDSTLMTTRVYRGTMRVASAIVNPQAFRGFVVPVLQHGFRIEKMTFMATEDGLNLQYAIIFREVAFSAPAPALSWDFQHTETTANGTTGAAEAFARLKGHRNTNKQALIQLAMQLVDAKLNVLFTANDNNPALGIAPKSFFIEGLVISDLYGDNTNEIQVRCRIQHVTEVRTFGAAGTFALPNVLGVPIDARKIANYDFSKSYGDGQVTTSGPIPVIAAFSAHLQAVCCGEDNTTDTCDHSFSRGYAANARKRQQDEFTAEIEAYDTGASLPESYRSNLSADHLRSMYTFAQIDNQYENSQRKVVCPVARNATNPNEVTSADQSSSSSSSNQDSVVVGSLCRPTARRVMRLKMERVGECPVLPEPKDFTDANGIKHILLVHSPMPSAPERTPDEGMMYRVEAEYHYALSRAPTAQEKLVTGALPWEITPTSDQYASNQLLTGDVG